MRLTDGLVVVLVQATGDQGHSSFDEASPKVRGFDGVGVGDDNSDDRCVLGKSCAHFLAHGVRLRKHVGERNGVEAEHDLATEESSTTVVILGHRIGLGCGIAGVGIHAHRAEASRLLANVGVADIDVVFVPSAARRRNLGSRNATRVPVPRAVPVAPFPTVPPDRPLGDADPPIAADPSHVCASLVGPPSPFEALGLDAVLLSAPDWCAVEPHAAAISATATPMIANRRDPERRLEWKFRIERLMTNPPLNAKLKGRARCETQAANGPRERPQGQS